MKKQKTKKSNKKKISRKDTIALFIKRNNLQLSLATWYTFCWSWVLFTDTLDLAGDKKQGFVIAILVMSLNVAISSYIMFRTFRFVKHIFETRTTAKALLISWPMFSLADFLVAWIPAFMWIGPQGRADSVLPLSTPTLLAINTPFGFSSRVIGFYGIAGMLWLILFLIINKKHRKLATYPLILLTIFSVSGWYLWRGTNGPSITATVISEKLDQRVPQIKNGESQLVIFPEYGLDKIDNDNLSERIENNPEKPQVYFLGSTQALRGEEIGHLNRLLYGDSVNGITDEQDKYRLIPGGEDLPYVLRTLLRATNQKSTLDYFSVSKGTLRGDDQLKPLVIDDNIVAGAAVCSSIISPEDYRQFSANGATILTNSASLTIFKGSPLFAWQQKSMAKFMAISNSRYFLQSANSARAYILDNNGNTLAETSEIKELTKEVKNNSSNTIYNKFGDIIVFIGFLVALYFVATKIGLWKRFDKFFSKT
jgi:hypothetical protein